MFKAFVKYAFAKSCFSGENTVFKKSLFNFNFSLKSQQEKSGVCLQVISVVTCRFYYDTIRYSPYNKFFQLELMSRVSGYTGGLNWDFLVDLLGCQNKAFKLGLSWLKQDVWLLNFRIHQNDTKLLQKNSCLVH